MDVDEVIRALVSVGLVVTMSLGVNCQGAAGSDAVPSAGTMPQAAVREAGADDSHPRHR